MKRLTLVRHANAEARSLRGTDFTRSLSMRGHAEAAALGKSLLNQNLIPDLLIASPAQRTKQTTEILSRELSVAASAVQYDEHLYRADPDDILRIAQSVDPSVRHLMIVGHNPAVSDLAQRLAPRAGITQLNTAAACTITFDILSWSDATPADAREYLSTPAR